MIETQSIATAPAELAAAASSQGGTVQKEQFLQLLVAQMKYQDPLNPMEGTEFTAQLAQFSSLEQLFAVNDSLGRLAGNQDRLAGLEAAAYLGRSVTSRGDRIAVASGEVSEALYRAPMGAVSGSLTIYDERGGIVRVLETVDTGPGLHSVTWNGADAEGNPVPDGTYRFQADFYDDEGVYLPGETFETGTVRGIDLDEGAVRLDVEGTPVSLDDVIAVR